MKTSFMTALLVSILVIGAFAVTAAQLEPATIRATPAGISTLGDPILPPPLPYPHPSPASGAIAALGDPIMPPPLPYPLPPIGSLA